MNKKIRCLIVVCMCLVMSSISVMAMVTVPTDVYSNDWFYEDVIALIDQGVINGFEDGTFRPNDSVNVDAFIKMMVEVYGYEVALSKEDGSTYDYWAQPYIDKAVEVGLIEVGTFENYQRPITRGEMALVAYNGLKKHETLSESGYYRYHVQDYEGINDQIKEAVLASMANGIITGYEDYTFRADGLATRAQGAAIIHRLIDPNQRRQIDFFQEKKDSLQEVIEQSKEMTVTYIDEIEMTISRLLGYGYKFRGPQDNQRAVIFLEAKLDKLIESGKISEATDTYLINYVKGTNSDGIRLEDLVENKTYIYQRFEETNTKSIIYEKVNDGEFYQNMYVIDQSSEKEISYFQLADEDGYTGTHVAYFDNQTRYQDLVEGYTYLVFSSGSEEVREQTVAKDGQRRDGYIYLSVKDEYEYVGELKNNSLTGVGNLVESNGTSFIGYFNEGAFDGEGVMTFNSGLILEDTFTGYNAHCINGQFRKEEDLNSVFNEKMDQIIAETTNEAMSLEEKAKAIHDYLVLNVEYDYESFENELLNPDINNAYAAIVKQKAVCLGYAQAYNLLLNRIGIESYITIGDTDLDGVDDHAWNYVKFEDGFYHVDVTWDDPDHFNMIRTWYFKKKDNELKENRTVSQVLGYDYYQE